MRLRKKEIRTPLTLSTHLTHHRGAYPDLKFVSESVYLQVDPST
jgi:hypothetical protein